MKIGKHLRGVEYYFISKACKVDVGKCTIGVNEQLCTLVHQCDHIEVTANISKYITLEAV